jgi:hypothetical protein
MKARTYPDSCGSFDSGACGVQDNSAPAGRKELSTAHESEDQMPTWPWESGLATHPERLSFVTALYTSLSHGLLRQ